MDGYVKQDDTVSVKPITVHPETINLHFDNDSDIEEYLPRNRRKSEEQLQFGAVCL